MLKEDYCSCFSKGIFSHWISQNVSVDQVKWSFLSPLVLPHQLCHKVCCLSGSGNIKQTHNGTKCQFKQEWEIRINEFEKFILHWYFSYISQNLTILWKIKENNPICGNEWFQCWHLMANSDSNDFDKLVLTSGLLPYTIIIQMDKITYGQNDSTCSPVRGQKYFWHWYATWVCVK